MSKEKEKLFKCFHCRGGEKKENLIQEKIIKNGKNINRYYHPHCFEVKGKNDNSVDLTKKYTKQRMLSGGYESIQHKLVKCAINAGIATKEITLVDQFGSVHMPTGEYITTEIPILYNGDIPYLKDGTCEGCFSKYEIKNHKEIVKQSSIPINKIKSKKIDSNTTCLKEHPCISCKFNTNYFKFIFDVGIVSNGKIDTVIEIHKTSQVTKEKLLYCIKNKITLLEISIDCSGNKLPKLEKEIKCERLWWEENGSIQVSKRYK